MNWKKMLAYITGSVDEELQRRDEYLVAENAILRSQLHGRIRLNNAERIRLAEIDKRLGRRALAEVAQIVSPETILASHRRLVARTFDGTKGREGRGCSTIPADGQCKRGLPALEVLRERPVDCHIEYRTPDNSKPTPEVNQSKTLIGSPQVLA